MHVGVKFLIGMVESLKVEASIIDKIREVAQCSGGVIAGDYCFFAKRNEF
jgi:hypothetical protein